MGILKYIRGGNMKITPLLTLVFLAAATTAFTAEKTVGNPRVILDTSKGKIVLELFPKKAPASVKNFLSYIDEGSYDGTTFHRVIPNFMIQGGGLTSDMKPLDTKPPIKNEADNGVPNNRGTIAMARTQKPHSATSQFFINLVNNDFLNHKRKDIRGWGYAVFGRVVEGMDVVDAISKVKTETRGMYRDVPIQPIIILKGIRLK
jgi:cyclophilin family peptidyl-prolyl cis-trans isomerase